jgi:hypothetical protein
MIDVLMSVTVSGMASRALNANGLAAVSLSTMPIDGNPLKKLDSSGQ